MKILVTGASGFVGGSFMRRFADEKNVALFGVSRRPTVLRQYARVDLTETAEIPFAADVVIHAAARASPWGTAAEFERQNVAATRNVLRYCENHGCPKLIYISSSSVFYRHEHQFGLTECSPIGPTFVNDYARTKYAGELLVRRYAGPYVILRPRAVFGPGDTVLFPRILRAARAGRLPLFIHAGTPARGDLIYIDSLCDYLFATCVSDAVTGDFNVTNAEPVVIQDFLLQALAALGVPAPTRRISIRTALIAADLTEACYRLLRLRGEPPVTRFGVSVFAYSKTFDVSKALRELGPPSVGLAEGTERFIRWQRTQG
jgi:nucleoside-diphosphate-sugar epimerase